MEWGAAAFNAERTLTWDHSRVRGWARELWDKWAHEGGAKAPSLKRNQDSGAGTSLVVRWLRIYLPVQGMWVRSLVWELRFHMPWGN